ncbi:MAG: hypothetical protein Q9218_002831 [Villophora microphyllina]
MARHGDLEAILLQLPFSYVSGTLFSPKQERAVYFGNWLRDFSQIIDTGALAVIPKASELLRIIVAIFGLLEFGYATRQFEVSAEALGVYRPEEHMDNPKGYPSDAQKLDPRLRGPVQAKELELDADTGMKNYIANESIGIATSTGYIRDQLRRTTTLGRDKQNELSQLKAMQHLGAALHTLEDFAAHTNYVELCLRRLAKKGPSYGRLDNVFPFVGESAIVQTKEGPAPPLVTGTFGPLDAFEGILGEIDDQAAGGKLGDLGFLDDVGSYDGLWRLASSSTGFDNLLGQGVMSLLPQHVKDQLNQLKSFDFSAKNGSNLQWEGVVGDPGALWNSIKSVFEVHDSICEQVEGIAATLQGIEMVKFVNTVSNAIDRFLFRQLAPFLKPLIKDIRRLLEEQRKQLREKEKLSTKDPETDVLGAHSTATNPTHTMLAKDHFDNILNNPAVSATVTSFTVKIIVQCWHDPNVDAENAINNILEAIHHPFNTSGSSEIKKNMFNCVRDWWSFKEDKYQQDELLDLLTKNAVEKGTNRMLISKPTDYHLQKLTPRDTGKPVIKALVDNIKKAQETGELKLSSAALDHVIETLQADATPEEPNPVDAALAQVALSAQTLFEGVDVQDIMSVPTIGELARTEMVGQLISTRHNA